MPNFYPDNTDFSTFWRPDGRSGMDPNWRRISGPRAVVERVLRRWVSAPGTHDNPTFGYPIYKFFNANLLPVELLAMSAGMRVQALLEEGVSDCVVTLTPKANKQLQISAQIFLQSGVSWRTVFMLSPDLIPRITLLEQFA